MSGQNLCYYMPCHMGRDSSPPALSIHRALSPSGAAWMMHSHSHPDRPIGRCLCHSVRAQQTSRNYQCQCHWQCFVASHYLQWETSLVVRSRELKRRSALLGYELIFPLLPGKSNILPIVSVFSSAANPPMLNVARREHHQRAPQAAPLENQMSELSIGVKHMRDMPVCSRYWNCFFYMLMYLLYHEDNPLPNSPNVHYITKGIAT